MFSFHASPPAHPSIPTPLRFRGGCGRTRKRKAIAAPPSSVAHRVFPALTAFSIYTSSSSPTVAPKATTTLTARGTGSVGDGVGEGNNFVPLLTVQDGKWMLLFKLVMKESGKVAVHVTRCCFACHTVSELCLNTVLTLCSNCCTPDTLLTRCCTGATA